MKRLALALALAGGGTLLAATAATAQTLGDRPSEQDLFGGGSTPAPPAPAAPPGAAPAAPPAGTPAPGTTPPGEPAGASASPPATTSAPPAAAAAGTSRDQEVLGSGEESKFLSEYVAPENPLQVGGQLYLRMQTTASGGQAPDQWSLSAPSLLDLYLDARPNPRVRGFVLGRMSYDSTLDPNEPTPGLGTMSSGALAGGNPTGFSTFSNKRGPASLLDQMWIRFDIEQKVFVTAGKQHVRWGTGRFWQPTDYLHQQKRNPLDVFDARGGTTMLKLNVPWEEKGWNFYGFAIADDPNAPTPTLRGVAGAFRAEVILAGIELGVDTYLRRDEKARFGFDASTGIWDFDVYADVAIRPGDDFVHYFPDINSLAGFAGYQTQAVGGVTYSRKYNDNDVWNAGIEYFYNHPGYTDDTYYPQLIQQGLLTGNYGAFPFFYVGRHYGAAYVSFPAPYSWNYTTFTLSTLGNLSDESFVTRLDYSVTFLTHLTLEAFAGVHYGHIGGEFRFRVPADIVAKNADLFAALPNPAALTDYPVVDLGVALRIKI
jgi:hypothetical protein